MAVTPDAEPPLVDIRGLTKTFGGTRALADVDLVLHTGSIHALLGQNGAGKSTLIKILAGVYEPTAGDVTVAGHPLGTAEAAAAMTFIHQDLGLVEWMSVAENIALGTGYTRRHGLISWRDVSRRCSEALQICADHLDPNTPISSLSRADRSLVAIARALAKSAKVIVLDEPTASLPAKDSRKLFDVLYRLRDRGHGIIYVSHRLDEVFEISDTVTVLRDGKVRASGHLTAYRPAELVEHIVGHRPVVHVNRRTARGPARVRLDGVVVGAVQPVSLTVRAGEVLGMTGLTGAGHMLVGRALAGAEPLLGGKVTIDGMPFAPSSTTDAVRAGVGFVTSNRMEEGCAPELTNRENLLANPLLRDIKPWSWSSPKAERRLADGILGEYGVRPRDTEAPIATLSGGNQQKIMIGRWLSVPRSLLVLEEPTAGVDVGAKADMYALLEKSLDAGLSVLLISTDFEEVAAVCDRALVFVQGRVTTELSGPDLTIPNLTSAAAAAPKLTEVPA